MDYQQRIIEASAQLFRKYGFRNVTVDEIAREAGISKRSLYETFENKEVLIKCVVDQHIQDSEDDLNSVAKSAVNAIEENIQLLKKSLKLFEEIDQRSLLELQRYYPEAWEKVVNHRRGFLLQYLVKNLRRGKEENLYRQDLKEEVIARMRLAQSHFIFDPEFFPQQKVDLKEATYEIIVHYIYGICSEDGLKEADKQFAIEGLL